jgi:hypothetical protein
MASSGEVRRVVVDLRSAAESAGDDDAHATPLHEIDSLCMRCGENVRPFLTLSYRPFSSVSVFFFGWIVDFFNDDCGDFRQTDVCN